MALALANSPAHTHTHDGSFAATHVWFWLCLSSYSLYGFALQAAMFMQNVSESLGCWKKRQNLCREWLLYIPPALFTSLVWKSWSLKASWRYVKITTMFKDAKRPSGEFCILGHARCGRASSWWLGSSRRMLGVVAPRDFQSRDSVNLQSHGGDVVKLRRNV